MLTTKLLAPIRSFFPCETLAGWLAKAAMPESLDMLLIVH